MLCGQQHLNYEFHRFKVYCTSSYTTEVHSFSSVCSQQTSVQFCDYTHMKCDPSLSCGGVGGSAAVEESGDGDRLLTVV